MAPPMDLSNRGEFSNQFFYPSNSPHNSTHGKQNTNKQTTTPISRSNLPQPDFLWPGNVALVTELIVELLAGTVPTGIVTVATSVKVASSIQAVLVILTISSGRNTVS